MRGERLCVSDVASTLIGSSPHARGTLEEQFVIWRPIRFIPACAGNAGTRSTARGAASVHPRMRGERDIVRAHVNSANGSSPHARGTRVVGMGLDQGDRFIPACAGNAKATIVRRISGRVHPRMRGERDTHWRMLAI